MGWCMYMVDLLDLRLHCDAEMKALMKRFMYAEISSNPHNDPQWQCCIQTGWNQTVLMETLTGGLSTVWGEKT